MEQPDIDQLVRLFYEKNMSNAEIIEILSSIIKQQMLFGGSLIDKLNYWKENLKTHL
jgi:hypothetical protein